MPAPTLSVLLPNYNHADYLPRCLDAILRQSFTDFELIVVDDASTDNSLAVLEEYARRDDRVRVYRNPENRGVAFSLNRSLELATGELVHGAAADDYILPGFFATAVGMLRQHPQAALALGLTDCFDDAGRLRHVVPGPWAPRPAYISPDELCTKIGECGVPGPAVWRRGLFVGVGAYNPALRWHCDWFALQVLAFRHGVCFFPEKTTVVRMAETAYSVAGQRDPKAQRPVLQTMLGLMGEPRHADILPRFRRSGVLRQFGPEFIRAAAQKPDTTPAVVECLTELALGHAPTVLGDPDPAVRGAMAAFLGRYEMAAFPFFRHLGAMGREPDPVVRAGAAAGRRAIRRAAPARVLYNQTKWTVSGVIRRVERFFRPLHYEYLDRIEARLRAMEFTDLQSHNALATINGNLEKLVEQGAARAAAHAAPGAAARKAA